MKNFKTIDIGKTKEGRNYHFFKYFKGDYAINLQDTGLIYFKKLKDARNFLKKIK